MFSKDLIISNNLSFSDTYCLNDILFVYSALLSSNRILFINEILYYYSYKYRKSRITNNKKYHKRDLITVYDQLYKWLENDNKFNDYKKAFFRKWPISLASMCSYQRDEDFIKQVCDYLSYSKPWSDLSAEELYCYCKFDLSLTKLKLFLYKIKSLFYRIIDKSDNSFSYKVEASANIIDNIQIIREMLKNEYNKQYIIKDNLIESIIRRLSRAKGNA